MVDILANRGPRRDLSILKDLKYIFFGRFPAILISQLSSVKMDKSAIKYCVLVANSMDRDIKKDIN